MSEYPILFGEAMRQYPDWFISSINNEEDKQMALDGTLKSTDKVEFYCKIHGVYMKEVRDVVKVSDGTFKGGCPKCGKQRTVPFPQWFIDEISEEFKDKAIKGSLEARDVVTMICPRHGPYQNTVGHLVRRLTGERLRICPKCKRNIPGWVLDTALDDVYSMDSRDKVRFLCPKHGEYTMRLGDKVVLSTGKQKCGCPMCVSGGHRSYIEKEICEFLDSLEIDYETNQKGLITTDGRNYEIDIYIPSLKIGIECNGSYWHASFNVSPSTIKDSRYHMNKFLAAEKHGIHLIQVFDVDYIYNKDRIYNYIKDLVWSRTKIHARKCSLVEINKEEANQFFDKYHIQGSALHNSYNIALEYEGQILSVMGLGTARYGRDEIELHRYCVRSGYTVVGGAQKLFKKVVLYYKGKSIVSYSDNDYFTGSIYPMLGFEFCGYTNPRYYWVDRKYDYRTREQCMLKNLKTQYPEEYEKVKDLDVNKEDAIMARKKFYKVYRSGNKIWRFNRIL